MMVECKTKLEKIFIVEDSVMKILYYDCFCGISGDMNLGALIDLGVDSNYLREELRKLKMDEPFELKIEKTLKKGISGTKVDVILNGQSDHPAHHHHHEQEHGKNHHHHHHPTHRNLADIETIIDASTLNRHVKEQAKAIFRKVAEAEAKVHGKALNDVHFHEVGATDSIVDIVGAAICLDYLKVDKIMSSTVQLGGGFVVCAHGKIPIPAPATVEILQKKPIKTGLVNFETTTPTGAAILAATVSEFTDQCEFDITKIGYGIGNRDLEIPNVLRVFLGESKTSEDKEIQIMIETNIDDMNPEVYDYLEEKLFEKGALDVFKTPIIMKKGRPATLLSILANKQSETEILDILFKETTSLGIRKYDVEKIMLKRQIITVTTNFGAIHVKKAFYQNGFTKYKAEYEDCKQAAIKYKVSIGEVYAEVEKKMNE
jgi:uncharacterized protein (TIGR00299 family) protein